MTSTATRRSSRLSASSQDDSIAGLSSRASSVIPAATSRKKIATGKERRLEDVIAGDETRVLDVSMGPFVPVSKGREKKVLTSGKKTNSDDLFASDEEKAGVIKPSRKPRKGEEAEGDFIFQRTDAPSSSNGSSSSRKRSQPTAKRASSSRRTFEPLPDEALGETPIIRRNKAYRAGLDVHPSALPRNPSTRNGGGERRSSLGLKGSKRMSSLRDGTAAYPHDDVPDRELYRHCSADLPPVVRMKHLVGWVLKRSLDAALGKVDPSDTKGKRKKREIPTLTEAEKRVLKDREESVKRVLEQLLSDLNDGSFGINWMGVSEDESSKGKLQPHPRNVSNKEAEARLSATVEGMTNESKAWSKEQLRIEDYEAETQRLKELLDSKELDDASVDEVLEWTQDDLDETSLRQLRDAEDAMEWLNGLLSGDRKAVEPGTEQDPRWREVEFNVDLLRSRSHQFSQLESLASRYVNTVSAQAAQALRDRTSSASKAKESGDQLERLLSGVRESRSEFRQTAREGMDVEEAFEPDESDAIDLLRALAHS